MKVIIFTKIIKIKSIINNLNKTKEIIIYKIYQYLIMNILMINIRH